MDSKQIKIRKNGIFKVLEKAFEEYGIKPEKSAMEVNPDVSVFTYEFNTGVNNDPVLSSIYFLPEAVENPDMLYLIQSLAIRDDIEDNEAKVLALQAANYINYNVPYGSFVLNPALEIMSFRNVIKVYEGMNDGATALYVLREINAATGIVGLYVSAINALIDKAVSWEEFITIVDAYTSKQE